MINIKKRLIYFFISVISFIACVLIVKLFANNQFIRGFIGDIIVILLIYFFVKSFYDFHPVKLIISVLFLAFTLEFFQYLKIIRILGLEQNIYARLIIGSVFDPLDLVAYCIGAIVVYVLDIKLIRGIF